MKVCRNGHPVDAADGAEFCTTCGVPLGSPPAGWYEQEDGSQRYWNGAAWMAGGQEAVDKPRPRTARRLWPMLVGLMVLLGIAAARRWPS